MSIADLRAEARLIMQALRRLSALPQDNPVTRERIYDLVRELWPQLVMIEKRLRG